LREIAEDTVGLEHLRSSVVRGMQKHVEIDEPEETHDLELDAELYGVMVPASAGFGEDEVAVAGEAEDLEEEEEVIEEEALDEELAEDILGADEDADLAEVPAAELPGDFDEEL